MKISPFTPLYFGESNISDGAPSRFMQVWAPTDRIMIQVIADAEEAAPTATLYDDCAGDVVDTITWNVWAMNEDKVIYFHVFRGLSDGFYRLAIANKTSDVFRVTSNMGILSKTTLIQYRFKDNKNRDDVVSVINGVPYFFDFRVPGGFKDSGWQFGVSNEQFTTQREDVVELYAYDYTLKTFTMGGSLGVPVWYGEMLNRLLTCSYVYFNGERYVRSDTDTPQINILVDGLDSFVFSQLLRRTQYMEPTIGDANQIAIRRVGDDHDRITDDENKYILIL